MLLMTLIIVAVMLTGFLLMSTMQVHHLNRAAVAMFCGVIVWVLYVLRGTDFLQLMHPEEFPQYVLDNDAGRTTLGAFVADNLMVKYVTEACYVILFLIATNTIVGVMNNNGVFDSLVYWLRMKSSKLFLWVLSLLTFVISANVDNLTTVVLMLTLMSQIVNGRRQKMIYASAILVAAHLGGSCTVIGDMTTLMLWVHKVVTATGLSMGLLLPALATLSVFTFLLSTLLKGRVEVISFYHRYRGEDSVLNAWQKGVMLFVGIAGLWSIPMFSALTHFQPFIGALCVLAVIWTLEGVFTFRMNGNVLFVTRERLHNTEFIGIQLILYYLGISLGVGALKECGALDAAFQWLTQYVNNVYAYGAIAGFVSMFIDNVPLVMSGMNMVELGSTAETVLDGSYWQMLSFCSAVGGCLIYSSTQAGHAVAEVEGVGAVWYIKHILWRVLIAWGVGMLVFWLIH